MFPTKTTKYYTKATKKLSQLYIGIYAQRFCGLCGNLSGLCGKPIAYSLLSISSVYLYNKPFQHVLRHKRTPHRHLHTLRDH